MSYHDQIFSFGDSGLILIEGKNIDEGGSNGSGKSSIWDGISWALFGQTVRGLKADEVIHRAYKKDCVVSCQFGIKGREYSVSRSRKHSDSGDRFWIVDGSEKIELGTVAQTQAWLEKELEIDFELFRRTVLFAQGETFNFVNETNKVQKDILSKVMKIDYSSMLNSAKEKLSDLKSLIQKKESEVLVLKSHIIKDIDEKFAEDIQAWESSRQEKIDRYCIESDKLIRQAEEMEIKPVDKMTDIQTKLKQKISLKKAEYNKFASELADQKSSRMFWEKRVGSIALGECSMCYQTVSEEHLCKEKAEAKKKIAKLSSEAEATEVSMNSVSEEIYGYEDKLSKVSSIINEQSGKQNLLKSIKSNIHSISISVAAHRKEVNPFTAKKEQEIERQKKIEKKIVENDNFIQTSMQKIPYIEFWTNAFGDNGIKSFVFDLICSTLTSRANMYLNTLSGGSVSVAFETQKKLKTGEYREKFDCVVMSGSERVLYEAYSGGEKRRISLAVDMALSDLMSDYHHTKFNMAIFDEQDSYLDDQGRRQFLMLLKDISKNKNVFVVAHDDIFKGMFSDVMRIEKRAGVSKVV